MGWVRKLIEWLTPTEQDRWWMAAESLRMEGYTDTEIINELGPAPIDLKPQEDSDA